MLDGYFSSVMVQSILESWTFCMQTPDGPYRMVDGWCSGRHLREWLALRGEVIPADAPVTLAHIPRGRICTIYAVHGSLTQQPVFWLDAAGKLWRHYTRAGSGASVIDTPDYGPKQPTEIYVEAMSMVVAERLTLALPVPVQVPAAHRHLIALETQPGNASRIIATLEDRKPT